MLPSTTVSANYHSFSSYFQVQEGIGIETYIQPIDRVWTLANKRLMSLKIYLPLANCSCKQTCNTLKLLNGGIYRTGMSECVSWKKYPATLKRIYNGVPINTECWGAGCDITVRKRTQAMILTWNTLQVLIVGNDIHCLGTLIYYCIMRFIV